MVVSKPISIPLAAGALVIAGAAFVPGTAEAHCFGHSNGPCTGQGTEFSGGHCQYSDTYGYDTLWYDYTVYQEYCQTPVNRGDPGCEQGVPVLECACAQCVYNTYFNCVAYTYSEDMGWASNCSPG